MGAVGLMTTGEFEILALLDRWGPLTATELHESGQYPESRHWQGYAAKLASMEKRGLVERRDPAAGIWGLADGGREVLNR